MVLTLKFDSADEALRRDLQVFIREHGQTPLPQDYDQRLQALVAWQARLNSAGFIGLSWPSQYGGRSRTLAAEAVLAEELASSAMAELINRLALYTWGPTILRMGTPEQKAKFLPGMLDASELWCQGFSEPGAGSDLAAIATSGRLDGDDFVVNGQKVWTSRAEIARWNALLVRTQAGSRRHRGLSLLIVDMKSPGITVRPLPQLLNEPHFSEVFFDDVRVPASHVLGAVHDGWRVAMEAMMFERGLFVLEREIRLQRRLTELTRSVTDHRATTTAQIGMAAGSLEVLKSQVYRTLAEQDAGTLRPGSTSIDKLFLAEAYQGLYATACDVLGEGVATEEANWTHDLLESRSVSIYSGTSEIQRNVIASQFLGLRES